MMGSVIGLSFALTLAFLIGAIPFSYVIVRLFKGIDIRTVGSGNAGATNVFRTVGKKLGAWVLAMDFLKGMVAVLLLSRLISVESLNITNYQFILGISAILGHVFTPFLKWKGGKGVATSAGVMLAIVPGAVLVSLGIWIVVVGISHTVSLGSLVAVNALPILVLIMDRNRDGFFTLILVSVTLALLITYRHRTNIGRLISGNERKTHF